MPPPSPTLSTPPPRHTQKVDKLIAHLAASHQPLMSEYMIEVFGITAAADTVVGDAMLRGVRWAAAPAMSWFGRPECTLVVQGGEGIAWW